MTESVLVATTTVAWLGFAIGLLFGLISSHTHLCTLGAVSDAVNFGDWTRMRMWLMAMAVAMFGAAGLQWAGLLDVTQTNYASPQLQWLSHIVGGLVFGVGMTLASGCPGKTLLRIGSGNLKAIVVFVFTAVAGYAAMRGLIAVGRVAVLEPTAITLPAAQDLPSLAALAVGASRNAVLPWVAAAIGIALAAFCLASAQFRQGLHLLGGIGAGLLVVAGWYVTAQVGYVAEHPDTLNPAFIGTNSGRAESLSFIAPYAYLLDYLILGSDRNKFVSFGMASVLGILMGAALHAWRSGSFRIEAFTSASDLGRHLLGAVLMGAGGVTAGGCTIGQGISGVSTLAVGSLLTFGAIVVGSTAMMKLDYWRMMREA